MAIKTADKLNDFQEYFFSRVNKLIAEVEADSGEKVISLGIGSPDLPPPAEVVARLKQELDIPANHKYPNYGGAPELRQAMASYYQRRFNVALNSNSEVLPLLGSKEGLVNACFAFMNPGDFALVPELGYPAYSGGPLLASGHVLTYPLLADKHWLPDLIKLGELLTEHKTAGKAPVRIWWLGYPNNPTGVVAELADLEEYVEFARKHELIIFYDNPYADVYWGGITPPASILEVPGARALTIEFNSLSKTYNLAGWRVGMAIGGAELIAALLKVKSNVDTGIFTAIQKACAFALDEVSNDWIKQRNQVYAQRADYLNKHLKALGFEFAEPVASLYIWAKIPQRLLEQFESTEDLSLSLVKEIKVLLTPGSTFGAAGEGYVRISLCQPQTTLEIALRKLENYMLALA